MLKLTEKQYSDIRMLTGKEGYQGHQGYQGKMIGRISSKIRTEVEKLRPFVRKFRKYEQEKSRISGEIRTEMGNLRPSVRISRENEPRMGNFFAYTAMQTASRIT